jgi:threonine/homoserine/homoserine lactone efflux protein
MPEKAAFLTFLAAALLLNLAPGPDMLYVIGRSVGQDRKAGVVSALGFLPDAWSTLFWLRLESRLCCVPPR